MKYINSDNKLEHRKIGVVEVGIYVNVCASNEHIPEIERRIRLSNKSRRCIRHGLPYGCIPKLMAN